MATTKAKKPKKSRAAVKQGRKDRWGDPVTIAIDEMAHQLNRSTDVIYNYVKAGTFPPPKLQPGDRKVLWMRDHFRTYIATGHWPVDAFPSGSGKS